MPGHSPSAADAGKKPTANWGPVALLGLLIGFTPVFAGLIFRTYSYGVSPNWAEALRQADVPFIFVELGVIMWAREKGMRFGQIVSHLDDRAKCALAIFLGTFWISSAFVSEEAGYSMIRASFWLIHAGFAMAVFHLSQDADREDAAKFIALLCAGLIAFVPLMSAHLAAAPDPATQPGGRIIWSSAIPGCLSVRHLGIWSALVLACSLGSLYLEVLPKGRALMACGIVFLSTTLLFWSGTRAGVYGIAGAALVLVATFRRLPPLRRALPAAVALGLGMWVSTLLWLPPEPAFGLFERDNPLPGTDLDTFSAGRLVLWVGMLKAFAGDPLFGLGEGAILWLVPLPGDMHHVQPHNSVVQMLSSWGLLASLAFAYLLARLLWTMHRAMLRQSALIALTLTIDCLLIMSLADGVMYFSRFIMWFAGASALGMAICLREKIAGLDQTMGAGPGTAEQEHAAEGPVLT